MSVSSALASSVGSLPEFMEVPEEVETGQAVAYEVPINRSAASDLSDYTKLPTYCIVSIDLEPTIQYGNSISNLSGSSDVAYYVNFYPFNDNYSNFELIYEIKFSKGYDPELFKLSSTGSAVGFKYAGFHSSLNTPGVSGIAYIDANTIRVSVEASEVRSLSSLQYLCGFSVLKAAIKSGSTLTFDIYFKGDKRQVISEGGGEGGGTGGSGSST